MIFGKDSAACTLFNSPPHQNRPVILVSGGKRKTTEVLDYTSSNSWEESKYRTRTMANRGYDSFIPLSVMKL